MRGLVLLCVALANLAPGAQGVQSLPDAAVKAAFVARFAEFVEWPTPPIDPAERVALCLSPSHPFGSAVGRLTGTMAVGGRGIDVRELRPGDTARGCHLLYVAPVDRHLLQQVRGMPVLTIGDEADFCLIGGMVNLRVIDGRVRFEVGLKNARAVGLNIDSQLLRLAFAVHGDTR